VDTTICEISPFKANAQAQYVQSIQWSSTGDGNFVDPTKIDAIYLRGNGDVATGEVKLYMAADGFIEGVTVVDSLWLSFSKRAIADAGNDTIICAGEPVLLAGAAQYQDSVKWETGGDGTFDDSYSLTPLYTPGPTDIASGYVWLTLIAYDSIPCEGSDNDDMKLTIDQCTNIDELSDEGMNFRVIPNPTAGRIKVSLKSMDKIDEEITLTLTNSTGQILFTYRLDQSQEDFSNELDLSYYPKGVYYLRANTPTQQQVRKVILQ
jgi:hypothetical protein